MEIILLILLPMLMLLCLYLFYRTNKLFDIRIEILNDSRWNANKATHIEYERLPSYNTMFTQDLFKYDYSEVYDDSLYDDIDPEDRIFKDINGKLTEVDNPKKSIEK